MEGCRVCLRVADTLRGDNFTGPAPDEMHEGDDFQRRAAACGSVFGSEPIVEGGRARSGYQGLAARRRVQSGSARSVFKAGRRVGIAGDAGPGVRQLKDTDRLVFGFQKLVSPKRVRGPTDPLRGIEVVLGAKKPAPFAGGQNTTDPIEGRQAGRESQFRPMQFTSRRRRHLGAALPTTI